MRRVEAIRIFETASRQARTTPTWRLRLWAHMIRRRLEYQETETNLLRLIAMQYELRHRLAH